MRRGRMGAAVVAGTMAVAFALVAAGVAAGTLGFATARILSASVLILSTAALAIDLRWGGWSRDALTRLVIDLGDRAEGTTLRDRLAAALDDPTLVIGYALDEGGTYVDDDGGPVELPPAGSGRVAVPLRLAGGIEVGVLVRDERWPIDPVLADGVAAAAELALGNARLHAATRRQVADLEASRERLIAAAEAERQRIRRELDDGAIRRLARVREALTASVALGAEREPLLEHVRSVMRQLAELSDGLGPASASGGRSRAGAPPSRRGVVGPGRCRGPGRAAPACSSRRRPSSSVRRGLRTSPSMRTPPGYPSALESETGGCSWRSSTMGSAALPHRPVRAWTGSVNGSRRPEAG